MKTMTHINHQTQLLIGIALSILLIPVLSSGQYTQTAYENSSKIAFVDHLRIRNEYKAFCKAKETITNTSVANKKAYRQSLKDLDLSKNRELTADAKKGGKKKPVIVKNYAAKKQQLTNRYQSENKKLSESMKAQVRAYENRITAVIEIIASQGGFTAVQPLRKGGATNGLDITALVLDKLN